MHSPSEAAKLDEVMWSAAPELGAALEAGDVADDAIALVVEEPARAWWVPPDELLPTLSRGVAALVREAPPPGRRWCVLLLSDGSTRVTAHAWHPLAPGGCA